MVLNRLCDPESKLGVLRWLETVALPEVEVVEITHQQLLRSMDALMDHQTEVDAVVAGLLRPLLDQDLSVVFYDLTTIRSEGLVTVEKDVRKFWQSKEGLIARQFMLGVVQTAEGLPIYHEVFDGNASETKTLLPTLTTVLARFPGVRRLILVADRGLLSLDNLESLQAIRLVGGQALEFIIAVPGRRYHEFADVLGDFQRGPCVAAIEEVIGELAWNRLRLVVAHDPVMAAIRAHASICYMALILHRVMRMRLRAANAGLTPERALEQLRRIQHHRIRINGAAPVTGVSSINDGQSEVLSALRVKKPSASQQLTLL